MWPFHLVFLFLLFVGNSIPPWLYVTLLHFSHTCCQLFLYILLQHHISKSVDLKLEELLFVVNCLVNPCYKCSIHHKIECRLAAPYTVRRYEDPENVPDNPRHLSVTPAWGLEEVQSRLPTLHSASKTAALLKDRNECFGSTDGEKLENTGFS